MFAAENWKETLLAARPGFKLIDFSQEPELTPEEEEIIEQDREVQKKQEKKWDQLNDDSFPASDPVARY